MRVMISNGDDKRTGEMVRGRSCVKCKENLFQRTIGHYLRQFKGQGIDVERAEHMEGGRGHLTRGSTGVD